MKYINFKRIKFSTFLKKINYIRYNFLNIFKIDNLEKLNFNKIYKYLSLFGINFKKVYKSLVDPKTYSIRSIKDIDFISNFITSKFLRVHLPVAIIIFGFLYIFIPTFYSYDIAKIENLLCKKQSIECEIKGKVNYIFYPTPRIKIKNLTIKGFEKNSFLEADLVTARLSFKHLLVKDKLQLKSIKLNNYEINFDLQNFKKYQNLYRKKTSIIPVNFENGKIIFSNKNKYIATINDANLNLIFEKYYKLSELKGKFLEDDIKISLNSQKTNGKPTTEIILKLSDLNFLIKAELSDYDKKNEPINGNILIKKDKYKFAGIINYKDNEIKIKKSNFRNIFLDGKLEGKIKLLPYFNFDLDLNLNSLNFTRLYNYFLALDESKQKNLFKINNKINGKLSLSSEKIYSSYNLVKSFESRMQFSNGNILVEQFLFNLGKLGAADLSGTIKNDKKFTNFKYESNVHVDNQKKFLSKFGIYNKKEIFPSLFVSGNFDLRNIRNIFYEISDNNKLNNEDINFVEKEFNNYMLSDGYENLFRFPKFKEFIKLITSETD